jgi:hypothetical protein
MEYTVKGRKIVIPFFEQGDDTSDVWGTFKANDWKNLLEKWLVQHESDEENKQKIIDGIKVSIQELEENESPSPSFVFRVGGTLNVLFEKLDSDFLNKQYIEERNK